MLARNVSPCAVSANLVPRELLQRFHAVHFHPGQRNSQAVREPANEVPDRGRGRTGTRPLRRENCGGTTQFVHKIVKDIQTLLLYFLLNVLLGLQQQQTCRKVIAVV